MSQGIKYISPVVWLGGKSKHFKLISSFFPKNTKDYQYIEAFAGGASIGLNSLKNDLFKNYIFNDLNEDLIDFWIDYSAMIDVENVFKENYFYPNVKKLSEAKAIYQDKLKTPSDFLGNRELLFLMKNNLTFNGSEKGTFTEARLKQNWNLAKRDRIIECQKLLKDNYPKIGFTNYNYWILITGSDDNFYFLDPPYYEVRGLYKHSEMNWNRFKGFLLTINDANSKFLLTINDTPETREMFSRWNMYKEEWKYTSQNAKGGIIKMGKELFVTNYEIEGKVKINE